MRGGKHRARPCTVTALLPSRPSLPSRQLIKLSPDGTFPAARGADRAWFPNCQRRAGACWGGWDTRAPPGTVLPAEPLISRGLARLLTSAASPLPGTCWTGMPTQFAEAACTVPPVQDWDQIPARGKGLGQLRLTVCRRSPKNRNPNHPQTVAGLSWRHKGAVLPPPVTAHARIGPGHSFALGGNFLRFLIITGN